MTDVIDVNIEPPNRLDEKYRFYVTKTIGPSKNSKRRGKEETAFYLCFTGWPRFYMAIQFILTFDLEAFLL